MIHCKKNFIQIDANQQSGIIICHYLFVKRNTLSKQFPIFPNHENTLRKSRSYTWTVYIIICQIEGTFLRPNIHDLPSNTRLVFTGTKESIRAKRNRKISFRCRRRAFLSLCDSTLNGSSTLSGTRNAFECFENFLSFCLCWDCIGNHRVGSNLISGK